ncbi:MAG: sulfatase-like hydrolase/transferase [Pirellulales bacterium]
MPRRWKSLLSICCVFRLTAILDVASRAAETKKPNILIIYSDDQGWGELGCQGNPQIPTPHIDSLAAEGVRFTQGYVAATYCSPSRAGLMTGRYPTRFGHEFNAVCRQGGLSLKETTLANRLKEQGYATVAIGKWHLGNPPEYHPTKRGFDEFFGTLANTPFFHPTNFIDSRKSPDVTPVKDESFYTTEKYAERAVEWLDEHKSAPWFLYLPFNAQHAPLQAPEKYLARFPEIKDEKRKLFAAMLSAQDDAVGRVLAKVRALGQDETTLIYYIADNGGPTNGTTSQNGGLRGFKMTTFEGGPRVPYIMRWKGKLPAGKVYEHPVLNLDVLPTVLTATGATIDPAWKLDGVDILPYVRGEATGKPHQTLYWRFGEQWAVRHGDHKLVVSRGGSGKPELYDLSVDKEESKDLAAAQPQKVAELQKLYDAWNAEQAPPTAVDPPNNGKNNNKNGKNKGQKKAQNNAKAATDES